jgi:hypothetical protein
MSDGVTSDGSNRAGGAWHTARRLLVSSVCAAVVVLIGSRINRPQRLAVLDARPRAVDSNLPLVDLDLTSLHSALRSIQRAAPPGALEVDFDATAITDPEPEASPARERPCRLRNVRLGTLLKLVIHRYMQVDMIECRQEPGRVVVGGPGTARRALVRRLYDVRDIVGPAPGPEHFEVPPSQLPPQLLAPPTGGGLFGVSSAAPPLPPYPAWWGEPVANLVEELIAPGALDVPAGAGAYAWGGWVLANTDEAGHRAVEELLLLLRRGDSGEVRWVANGSLGGATTTTTGGTGR